VWALITTRHQKPINSADNNRLQRKQAINKEVGYMNSILKLTVIPLLFILTTGCEEKDQQAKAPDPVVFKTQLEALEKAKQVEGVLQDEAVQQRKTIDESTDGQKQ
jgi:hypothetical protein